MKKEIEIFVKTSLGLASPITLKCKPEEQIGTLLNRASADQGITNPRTVSLTFDGEVLDNEKRVKEVGLDDGDTLYLVPSHREVGASSHSFSKMRPKGRVPTDLRKQLARETRMIRIRKIPMTIDKENPYHWVTKIRGSGIWKGQDSYVHIILSKAYPHVMPKIIWRTRLDPNHPNIFYPNGWVCISSLKKENWNSDMGLINIYEELVHVIDHPHYHPWDKKPWLPRKRRISNNSSENSSFSWTQNIERDQPKRKGFFDHLKGIIRG